MTQKDFEESIDAVLIEHLEENLTPAELTRLKRALIIRVRDDWDPFEDPDPLDVGEDTTESSYEKSSYSMEEEDAPGSASGDDDED